MNTRELAAFLEDTLQDHIQISIKVAKPDYAVFDVEDNVGNTYVLRLTHVKVTDEDDENVDIGLD